MLLTLGAIDSGPVLHLQHCYIAAIPRSKTGDYLTVVFKWVKQYRCIGTSYDKTAATFLVGIHLAAAVIWLI